MFQLNGQPISIDSEQTINGVRYPNLRDPALREQLGVVEVADPELYDQRFYWGPGNPKQLDDIEVTPEGGEPYTQSGLKSQWVGQVKDTAGKLLAASDWMVVRQVERQVAIPADVAAKRLAIVAECDRLETAISGCATVEELINVINNQTWPE